jgi:hypothetical protein
MVARDPLTVAVLVRCTPAERARMHALAADCGCTLSELVRRTFASRLGPSPKKAGKA